MPQGDARGNITSHRARSTIATQLYNAKEPLTLFELQAWLGHHSPATTQHDAKLTPTKLAKAYEKAGYFGRTIPTIEVLIDQDAIKSGAASKGEPWRFFDLGHGYCQRGQLRHNGWKGKRTYCTCYKRFPSMKKSEQQLKTGSRQWKNCVSNSPMCLLLLGQHRSSCQRSVRRRKPLFLLKWCTGRGRIGGRVYST